MSSDPPVVQRRHPTGCQCVRCTGFMRGNDLSERHGAYAVVKLGPRTDELADSIRPLVPGYRASDELAVRTLALVTAQIEKAFEALESVPRAELAGLRADMRGWVNTERRLLNDLGLTPMARAKLHLDVARTEHEETLTELAARARLEAVIDGESVELAEAES